jgi:hypothetical protein
MTSGITGESQGLLSIAVVQGNGESELALGKEPSRVGASAAIMTADPGEPWDYSDVPAVFAPNGKIKARGNGLFKHQAINFEAVSRGTPHAGLCH